MINLVLTVYRKETFVLILWKVNPTSPGENRTPVSRVTGGDNHHYTTEGESNMETILINFR